MLSRLSVIIFLLKLHPTEAFSVAPFEHAGTVSSPRFMGGIPVLGVAIAASLATFPLCVRVIAHADVGVGRVTVVIGTVGVTAFWKKYQAKGTWKRRFRDWRPSRNFGTLLTLQNLDDTIFREFLFQTLHPFKRGVLLFLKKLSQSEENFVIGFDQCQNKFIRIVVIIAFGYLIRFLNVGKNSFSDPF